MALVLLLVAGVAALIRSLLMRVVVEGPSMEPALRDGDRVLVARAAYWWRPPKAGEIVVARVAAVPGGLTVKRVLAGPGAVVEGEGADAPRAQQRDAPRAGRPTGQLGAGQYFLSGDNRRWSVDSRRFGPVFRRAMIGRVWYRYWPPERRGLV